MAGTKRNRGGDSWLLTVTLGTDYTGKKRRFNKTVHCKSEREADKELAKFYAACCEGDINSSSPTTVKDLCAIFYDEYVAEHLKANTQKSCRAALNTWIIPLLGKRKINTLKKRDIQMWVNELKKQLSPKTVKNYFSVLDRMMRYAVNDLEILSENPCDRVTLPKQIKKEAHSYETHEVEAIVQGLNCLSERDLHYKCAILLAMFGGLRKGEILGLDWCDVDFNSNEIYIHQTRYDDSRGNTFIDTPKSEKSFRRITIPAFIMDDLKQLKRYQSEQILAGKMQFTPAVLHGDINPTMSGFTLRHRFNRLCESVGVPCYGLHALRHTQASMLADMGVNIVQASKRLGHSEVTTTLNIYSHLFQETDKTIANQLDQYNEMLNNKQKLSK